MFFTLGIADYIYYGCNRSKNLDCKCGYLREEELIKQLVVLIEKVEVEEKFIKKKFTEHVLTEGSVEEKREMLANLRGKIVLTNKVITVVN